MIEAKFILEKSRVNEGKMCKVIFSGHACEIVCASASTMMYMMHRYLTYACGGELEARLESGDSYLIFPHNAQTHRLFQTAIDEAGALERSYPAELHMSYMTF